jgi:SAM-dependent methyltransferase
MKNTVERFSDRVENYVKYRPSYPPEVLRLFETEMNLRKDSVLADVGSGTGISSKLFLENGNLVFGVEPNREMRRAAEEFLRDFPNFASVDGTAENTNLPAGSVDFVIAAQAFHWFDRQSARREFGRILREKGFIALVWNERRLDGNDFLREYERFLIEFGTDYETVRHDNVDRKILEDFFRTDFSTASFLNSQTLDLAGLKGRALSSSYMPSESDSRFEPMIIELKRLFDKYAENGKIQILYDTNVHYSQI